MAKYKVSLGSEFDVAQVEVLKVYEESQTRRNIAYIILGGSIGALISATGLGYVIDDLSIIGNVWAATGPLVGGVVGYYMNPG